jgi:hypothetical protein
MLLLIEFNFTKKELEFILVIFLLLVTFIIFIINTSVATCIFSISVVIYILSASIVIYVLNASAVIYLLILLLETNLESCGIRLNKYGEVISLKLIVNILFFWVD